MSATAPRVLCLCPLGPPMTGQAAVSLEVLHYLREQNCAVSVVSKATAPGVRKALGYLLSLPQILWHLLLVPRPQLAYFTCSRSPGGFLRDALFIVLCRLRRVPVVNHVHGSDLPVLLGHRLLGAPARRLLNGLAVNIVPSWAIALDCERAGLQRLAVIRNFTVPAVFDLAHVPAPAGAPLRILFLSNVMQAKGVFDLIEACLRLPAGGFELRVVGEILEPDVALAQETRARIEAAAREYAFLKWLGPLYGYHKLGAYREADVYCLPSHNEGAPLALLEAMAAGVACVATSVGAIPEIATDGETALLVPPHDPQALAARLAQLLESPQRRRELGERARAHALQHFTLARFRAELGEVLRQVLPVGL